MTKKVPSYNDILDAEKLRPVFEGFFKLSFDEKIKELRVDIDKQDSKSFQIMLGAVIVAIIFIAGVSWDSHLFREGYNEYFLQTQQQMTEKVEILRKENSGLKEDLQEEMEKTTNKQNDLEKILIQRGIVR